MKLNITEGYMPYLSHQTYYRIVTSDHEDSSMAPLILMHGGPGSTHNYFEVLDSIALTGRKLVMYDQIGCGNSYLDGNPSLWTPQTWDNELINLREHLGLDRVHLLGQSWGGMLAIEYISDYNPSGICSAILSSTLPSSALWAAEQHRMIKFMSEEDQKAIAEAERTGNYSFPEYTKANEHFMLRHCASAPDESSPECLRRAKKSGSESYLYGWGPNEYTPTGSLRDFEYREKLKTWTTPSLIISGTDDLCTPLVAKTMYDLIPDSEWELFPNARHSVFAEYTEKYISVVNDWMSRHD